MTKSYPGLLGSSGYEAQYETYRSLYPNAELIQTDFKLTNQAAFEYCQARSFFVIVTPYDQNHELLVERTFASDAIKWSLLGGSVKRGENETFLEAANRMAQYSLPGIEISDIEPFAFIENRFSYDGRHCKHKGIAFTGRIRTPEPKDLLASGERTRGHFVPPTLPVEEIAISHNRRVFECAVGHVSRKPKGEAPFHEREVSINEMYQGRYIFHDRFVKPVMSIASNYFGETSISEYKKIEKEIISRDGSCSIIDVACGENDMCEKLSKLPQFTQVVGNDISFSQVELLNKKNGSDARDQSLIYTNHDATDLPFADDRFDISICKNVLHHMPDSDAIQRLLDETVRVAKRALIVEVMNPEFESIWGRLRHNYYVHFLQDAYVHFLSRDEFEGFIEPYRCLSRMDCKTFRGVYFMAELTKAELG